MNHCLPSHQDDYQEDVGNSNEGWDSIICFVALNTFLQINFATMFCCNFAAMRKSIILWYNIDFIPLDEF